MKKLTALVLAVVLLSPGLAFAGSSTDAALGLGAFAVFNQILGGVGLFGGLARPAPVYVAPPPAVVYAPPPPVVYAPPPPVVYAPPPPVVYAPPVVIGPRVVVGGPVFVRPFHHRDHFPRPVVVYRHW
ncbi:MAG TPA: hypothetical protein VK132_01420 [Gemmatimonadales bacterium]|nr:hypothetical protein [Gemmatimonadales bacterium]